MDIAVINDAATDHDSIKNYFPNLSAAEFKDITGTLISTINQLMEKEPSALRTLKADKARRFLKKLIIICNNRWLAEENTVSTEEHQLAETAMDKMLSANTQLKDYITKLEQPEPQPEIAQAASEEVQ